MGALSAVRACFARYATFSGRSSRAEFWWFVVFSVAVYHLARLADLLVEHLAGRSFQGLGLAMWFGTVPDAVVRVGLAFARLPFVRDAVFARFPQVFEMYGWFSDDGVVVSIVLTAMILPGLAVAWRRMHDVGRSGWWFLPVAGFAPLYYVLVVLAMALQGTWPDLADFAVVLVASVALGYALSLLARPGAPEPNRFDARKGAPTP